MYADPDRLVPLQENGDAVPLYCVHAISGSAYAYLGLAQALGSDQPVYAFEAPGFDSGRTPVSSVPDLAAEYAAVLREFRPATEYRLLGWSMGGVLAFDIACRLIAAGDTVSRLILIDSGVPWVAPFPPDREVRERFLRDLLPVMGVPLAALEPIFAAGPDPDESAERLFERVERSQLLPAEIDAELLQERYAVFHAHLRGLFGYAVTETFAGSAVHIVAEQSWNEHLRWGGVIGDLTEHTLPGDHHSIWSGDSFVTLTKIVREYLG